MNETTVKMLQPWKTVKRPANMKPEAEWLTTVRDLMEGEDYEAVETAFRERYAFLSGLTYGEAYAWITVRDPEVARAISIYGDMDDEFYEAMSDLLTDTPDEVQTLPEWERICEISTAAYVLWGAQTFGI